MTRDSRKVLVLLIVLLSFAGCKKQSSVTPPAVPPPAAQATGTDTSKILINAHAVDTASPEVHQLVTAGTVLLWHDGDATGSTAKQFWVVFDSGHNPCVPNSPTVPDIYEAQPKTNPADQTIYYEAQCTIADKHQSETPPYRYTVTYTNPTAPSDKKKKKKGLNSGHCEGCAIDE